MARHFEKLIIIGTMGFALAAFSGVAHAYALPGTTSGTTAPTYAAPSFYYGGWTTSTLLAPFQNFTQSLQSIGNTNLRVTVPTAGMPNFPDVAAQTAHGAFEQFDAWLAGITGGFHIAVILTVFLQLMSWLLGIVKGGIDWALSWIH
jgi:hypothetical protein